jgi:LETM1 and EF-hand domain-containing protein 1
LRTDPFIFKTADFVKRNWYKFSHTASHIWDELVKLGQGFKKLNEDFKFYLNFKKTSKFGAYDYKQEVKAKQVRSDLLKFIPFSLFIIVPGLEMILPAWLVVFPKSIPSQF